MSVAGTEVTVVDTGEVVEITDAHPVADLFPMLDATGPGNCRNIAVVSPVQEDVQHQQICHDDRKDGTGRPVNDMSKSIPPAGQPTPLKQPEKVDPQWHEKITLAARAREMGAKQRAGKPKSFRRAVGRAQ